LHLPETIQGKFVLSHLGIPGLTKKKRNNILLISQHSRTVNSLQGKNEAGFVLEMSDLFSLFFVTSG
jgi:hypothetical protein